MMKKLLVMLAVVSAVTWQGCDSEVEPGPVDCNENPVMLSLVATEDAECNATNGSIEVGASGGSGKYNFILDEGDEQTSSFFGDLGAGVYKITAVDANDCKATLEVSVQNSEGMNVTFTAADAGCNTSNGTLTVNAVDGTPPYQFKLDAGSFGTTNTFAALESGEYNLVVADASGCEVNQVVRIESGVSYSASISGIISGNCAISGCHNGTQFPDFRQFKNIHDNAGQIKVLTQNRTMPQTGTLTQEQIDLIGCWVDDGALQN